MRPKDDGTDISGGVGKTGKLDQDTCTLSMNNFG